MADQIAGYPMISERNWWTLRDKFKASVPNVVTPNYVKTLLTLSSDASASSNVIGPLKRMGLLDEDGKPTALANNWRLDDKYKEVCNTILRNVYDPELLALFPENEIDKNMAQNWFMGRGVGQDAARKMVAVFSLLKSGEIKQKGSISDKKAVVKQATTKAHSKKEAPTTKQPSLQKEPSTQASSHPNLHIDLQIHISPDSTPEQIETIFASMAKHLYGADN